MVSVNVALCSGQFAMSVLQTFFMFYYVKVYLNIFKIDEFWFAITQGLFIVWNALNDPIFGYAQVIILAYSILYFSQVAYCIYSENGKNLSTNTVHKYSQ
ncbi:unnamed protein product [Gongylonema pulchrum]|uniref:Very-long-chain 3-oxoacyl-CoA synthase n=1 Tax=Gongylonema pulchrum TaxID=637853 RepID=A0A183ERU7_9BILA|nr:unnamed protein product [Gongylonema pulchrum]